MMTNSIKIFEEKEVRTLWDEKSEKWFVSIVDVVYVLVQSKDYQTARKYWNKLKQRLKAEGNETVTNCHQLKMKASDGKMRFTDVADTEQLFRLIQSITELILSMLAEASTKDISQATNPETFEDSKDVASQGGSVAKVAREALELKTGKKVVTKLNAKSILQEQKKLESEDDE